MARRVRRSQGRRKGWEPGEMGSMDVHRSESVSWVSPKKKDSGGPHTTPSQLYRENERERERENAKKCKKNTKLI